MIEAIVGQSDAGDIAIDDIKIQEGDCPPPGSCNFEVDTCSYYNIEGYGMDDFDWLRSAGGTVVAGTGPAVDHTSDSDAGKLKKSSPSLCTCSVQIVEGVIYLLKSFIEYVLQNAIFIFLKKKHYFIVTRIT